jgi:hypothetical protein
MALVVGDGLISSRWPRPASGASAASGMVPQVVPRMVMVVMIAMLLLSNAINAAAIPSPPGTTASSSSASDEMAVEHPTPNESCKSSGRRRRQGENNNNHKNDGVIEDGYGGDGRDRSQRNPGQKNCRLYVAPSTIPNAGLGVFFAAPQALQRGDAILGPSASSAAADGVIPIRDLVHWNNKHNNNINQDLRAAWSRYTCIYIYICICTDVVWKMIPSVQKFTSAF